MKIYVLMVEGLPTEFWIDKKEAHKMAAAYDHPNSEIVAFEPVVKDTN